MLDAGLSLPMDMQSKPLPKEIKFHPITRKSAQDYITYATVDMARQSNTATYKSIDLVNIGRTTAYCRPSEESINLSGNALHGQDAISVVVAENVHIISQADGTSQSYLGEIAAKASTQSIANNPSVNPETNLQTAIKATTDQHSHLPDPDLNLADITRQALLNQKDYGSETMLNIYSIDEKTGVVSGILLGDGGFTIVRSDGSRKHYVTGKTTGADAPRLSTKHGQKGVPASIEQIVGEEVVLQAGDSFLIYSDALQHPSSKGEKRMLIDDICDDLGTKNPKEICDQIDDAAKLDQNPDDLSLVVYHH